MRKIRLIHLLIGMAVLASSLGLIKLTQRMPLQDAILNASMDVLAEPLPTWDLLTQNTVHHGLAYRFKNNEGAHVVAIVSVVTNPYSRGIYYPEPMHGLSGCDVLDRTAVTFGDPTECLGSLRMETCVSRAMSPPRHVVCRAFGFYDGNCWRSDLQVLAKHPQTAVAEVCVYSDYSQAHHDQQRLRETVQSFIDVAIPRLEHRLRQLPFVLNPDQLESANAPSPTDANQGR